MDEVYIYDDSLYHFGRSKKDGALIGSGRYPLGSGRKEKKEMKRMLKDAQRWQKQVNKSRKNLSDEELDAMIARLKKENELNDLYLNNNPNSKTAQEGKNAVKKALIDGGTTALQNIAKTALQGAALYGVNTLAGKVSPNLGKSMATGSVQFPQKINANQVEMDKIRLEMARLNLAKARKNF